MNTVILYSSKRRLSGAHTPLDVGDGRILWIRATLIPTRDLSDALDFARPMPGETVLNAVTAPNKHTNLEIDACASVHDLLQLVPEEFDAGGTLPSERNATIAAGRGVLAKYRP